jgi:transposase-like protein
LRNLRANGHPSGGPWRQFHCTSCNGYFPEHHGTIFHGKQAAVELIVRVLACLAEGLGIRATARVFEVDPNTVEFISIVICCANRANIWFPSVRN